MCNQTNNNPGSGLSNQNPVGSTTPPPIPDGPDFRILTETFSLNSDKSVKGNKDE